MKPLLKCSRRGSNRSKMWGKKACRLAYSIGQPFAAMGDGGRELK
jgi:hypothetical protein